MFTERAVVTKLALGPVLQLLVPVTRLGIGERFTTVDSASQLFPRVLETMILVRASSLIRLATPGKRTFEGSSQEFRFGFPSNGRVRRLRWHYLVLRENELVLAMKDEVTREEVVLRV